MRTSLLVRSLQRALLVGSPLGLASCVFASSSCPDNGNEPAIATLVTISPTVAGGGPLSADECRTECANANGDQLVTCVRQGPDSLLCLQRPFPCEGRRPFGLRSTRRSMNSDLACHLSDAAWLEAASVAAFKLLRLELRTHGAPRPLLRGASRSARDERRHARATRALARRFGVEVPAVERNASGVRPLHDLALENAVEGCVRETWGALVALYQAEYAADREVRAVMSRIARDEVRHAELAWRIDRWLTPRLSPAERRRVQSARSTALAELRGDLEQELDPVARTRLGLPDRQTGSRMLAELDRSLELTAGG